MPAWPTIFFNTNQIKHDTLIIILILKPRKMKQIIRCIPILSIVLSLGSAFSSCSKPNLSFDFGNFGNYGSLMWDPNSITIYNNRFTPDTLQVIKGTTFSLYNTDSYTHNIISANDPTFGGTIAASGQVKYTANNIGSISYKCTIHFEAATIIVRPY